MPTEDTGRPAVHDPSTSSAVDEDPEFEREAERAEEEAVLDKEIEDTFPTSDPPSSWAAQDPDS